VYSLLLPSFLHTTHRLIYPVRFPSATSFEYFTFSSILALSLLADNRREKGSGWLTYGLIMSLDWVYPVNACIARPDTLEPTFPKMDFLRGGWVWACVEGRGSVMGRLVSGWVSVAGSVVVWFWVDIAGGGGVVRRWSCSFGVAGGDEYKRLL
jgi:hypothetical protein